MSQKYDLIIFFKNLATQSKLSAIKRGGGIKLLFYMRR